MDGFLVAAAAAVFTNSRQTAAARVVFVFLRVVHLRVFLVAFPVDVECFRSYVSGAFSTSFEDATYYI